ncbi:putative disease resistance RPP13-like protein 1 isoform X1 [Iris pallida]|uniref:Disease resistance RPP13-like protein 1 isoform X1 n=1 Tax=Iris pallida TaxID=29817 RepID=A0AAX6FPT3_IRIPA|nr:putative disease resistance RPP13-like protein 1 isoform X1 [Iris pallida]
MFRRIIVLELKMIASAFQQKLCISLSWATRTYPRIYQIYSSW